MSTVERAVEYGQAGGESLVGDFYRADGVKAAPVVIAVHGGAWKLGTRDFYRYWGPFLASKGIALFAVDYRLVAGAKNRYPAAVEDVRSAVRFLRANAAKYAIDPARIALMGDSAGAHLAALVGLTGATDPQISVKVVVGIYGVYDLIAQWEHDQVPRPRDSITEVFLGTSPMEDRNIFHDASPLTHAITKANKTAFLIVWGESDDVVDWQSQSGRFLSALKAAGYFARPVPLAGAPHFWMEDPIDEPGSHTGFLAPRLLRFLQARL